MVVTGLEPYITRKIPQAVCVGNLKDLIKQESQHGRLRPTIVLDVSATRALFNQGTFHCNWHTREIKKNVENFVENIISYGADLIVVSRGNQWRDVESWFYKVKSDFLKKKKELHSIMKGKLEKNLCESSSCIINTFSSISRNHYSFFTSIDYVHKEVAEIAITQNCCAVIGQDSNYLIYEGIQNYISVKSLNIKTLECRIYDREKLTEHFNLTSYHLPLFATLCGNDVVQANYLVPLHKKISQSNKNKFLCISDVTKSFSGNPYKHINNVVKLINHPNVHYNIVKSSLDMYLNFEKIVPQNEWLVLANERKKTAKWCGTVYRIFTTKQFRCDKATSLGDSNALLAVTMLRPLRQKIYGILLYEDDNPVVNEYCLEEMLNLNSFKALTPKKVVAVKPKGQHPGLIHLYSGNTPDLCSLKWNLFHSSVNVNLNHLMIKKIPAELLFPVLALHYLEIEVPKCFSQRVFIEKFEIEMFLVVAVLVYKNLDSTVLSDYHFKPNVRVTSLILNFIEVCFTLKMLNEACGLVISGQESCMCNFFDGTLLHYVYEKMSKGTQWYEFFDDRVALDFSFSSLMEFLLLQNKPL